MITYDFPDLTHLTGGFPNYWLKIMLLGDKPADYPAHAQMHTIVRLAEVSVRQYEATRRLTHVLRSDGSRINVGAMNEACASLEACLTNMHRLIAAVRALRGHAALPANLRQKFPKHLGFLRAQDSIRGMRDAIQHTLDMVVNGEIPDGKPITLNIGGPQEKALGKFHQTVDRVSLGTLELKFADIAKWLTEMNECATIIAEFSPRGNDLLPAAESLPEGPAASKNSAT